MSGVIRSFRDLDVWRMSMDLVVAIYGLAQALPQSERFELSAQLRRSAISIPSNVAEGHARRGKAFRNHVVIALGSQAELDTQIELAVRLGYLRPPDTLPCVDALGRIGQMLHGLERSLEAKARRVP